MLMMLQRGISAKMEHLTPADLITSCMTMLNMEPQDAVTYMTHLQARGLPRRG
jgi:hypothetical protein